MKLFAKMNRIAASIVRHKMRVIVIILAMLFLVGRYTMALAQDGYISTGNNLVIEGVPPIPASLAQTVKRYTRAYGLPLAGWDSTKSEVWLKNITADSASLYRVVGPGKTPQPFLYIPAVGIYDLYFAPQGRYVAYNRDQDGNESFQLYLYDLETRKSTLLNDGNSRNTEPVWSNKGDQIIYSSSPVGGNGVSLSIVNPLDPKTSRLIAQSKGTYFRVFDWSPDDRQAIFVEYVSNTQSTLWLLNLMTGERANLSPVGSSPNEYYDSPQFSKDGRGIYVITDHNSDVRRLAYIDLASRLLKHLSNESSWNVDEFRLAPDGKKIIFVTNEEGISRLHVTDLESEREDLISSLPTGIVSDLKWRGDSQEIAFNYKSSRTPGDVYSLNISTRKLDRWVAGKLGEADIKETPEPELIHWKSFDSRTISGFLFRPPIRFKGKRPVIIEIHGGPEEQYRPNFWGEDNYLLNELGVAKIYPNVRGSSGYGKTFLNLDNGMNRENSIKDVGALLDWLKNERNLDAERVMVSGASYGGFMAMSVATHYPRQIRAAQSISGPSDLVTFLENTEGWRRDVRRAEYGDERDPKMRDFLESISPLNHAQEIKGPLFIVQGANDPRVKPGESERMLSAVKKNHIPTWYLMAKDEGHDFINTKNLDTQFYATVLFIQQFLLR